MILANVFFKFSVMASSSCISRFLCLDTILKLLLNTLTLIQKLLFFSTHCLHISFHVSNRLFILELHSIEHFIIKING
uniref:Uncharacterized protein n=1 Tax=Lepeophtheirus salmonis TaxID=72036 RepID=A0A0K2T1W3_LEPSM